MLFFDSQGVGLLFVVIPSEIRAPLRDAAYLLDSSRFYGSCGHFNRKLALGDRLYRLTFMFLSRLALVVVGLASSLFAAAPCPTAPAKLDRVAAVQFERDWLKALQDKNVAALDCLLAPQFQDTSWKGALSSKEQVLRELPQRSDEYHQDLADVVADIFGDTAVVRGVNVISDRQGHEVMRIRFTDVLRRDGNQLRAIAAQETAEANR